MKIMRKMSTTLIYICYMNCVFNNLVVGEELEMFILDPLTLMTTNSNFNLS